MWNSNTGLPQRNIGSFFVCFLKQLYWKNYNNNTNRGQTKLHTKDSLSKREKRERDTGTMRSAPHEIKVANYTYTLTKSTNRKYNEKYYKDYELWQGLNHELGTMYTACPRQILLYRNHGLFLWGDVWKKKELKNYFVYMISVHLRLIK